MSHKLLSPEINNYVLRSINYIKNREKFPHLDNIFFNYDYWKICVYTLDAYEKESPISKIDLIKKINCSYKTANKYIDVLVNKKILICINQKNINILKIRKINFINNLDKRYCYYIPSLILIKEIELYQKKGY